MLTKLQFLFAYVYDLDVTIDNENKYEKHNRRCNKRIAVHIGCVAHFNNDIGRHCTHAFKQTLRHTCLVARNHNYCHCFANRTAKAQNNSRHNARIWQPAQS